MFKEKIIIEMREIFKEIPFGIEHTFKVLQNAENIMRGENIGNEEKEFISIIAILHDIGAVEAQEKYGSIDGLDFQIQWEANLLEDLTAMDKEKEQEKIKRCIDKNFKTATGKRIAYNRFILD